MKEVDIYTDGACSGNPGAGGYGIVFLYKQNRKELYKGYKLTTNNRMELKAIIVALKTLKEPCIVNLYSDSKYALDSIQKGWVYKWQKNNWKRNKNEKALNSDLWQELLPLLEVHKVNFIWVKGHDGNIENERCDELARNAIKDDFLEEDENYAG